MVWRLFIRRQYFSLPHNYIKSITEAFLVFFSSLHLEDLWYKLTKSQRKSGLSQFFQIPCLLTSCYLRSTMVPTFFFSSEQLPYIFQNLVVDWLDIYDKLSGFMYFLSCGAWVYMLRAVLLTLCASGRELRDLQPSYKRELRKETSIPVLHTLEYLIVSIFSLSPHSRDL